MKLLLALVLIGVVVWFVTDRAPPLQRSSAEQDSSRAVPPANEDPAASQSKVKRGEWDLSADSIRDELARTGQVVREKARSAGERLDDARVVAAIKSKFALDSELSALGIRVACADGHVTLEGSVASEELVGRAMELALHTEGVTNVQSRLTVAAPASR